MNRRLGLALLVVLGGALVVEAGPPQRVVARTIPDGLDTGNAAAYPQSFGAAWDDGSDGFISNPGAFGPWRLFGFDTAGSFSGFEFASSTQVAGGLGADIDTAGVSFKLYGSGRFESSAYRDFNQPLALGQTFSIDLAVNFRNGLKGIDVRDPNENTIFSFVVCCDDYVVANAATGNGSVGDAYSNETAFRLELTQTSTLGGTWTLTRSGAIGDVDTGSYAGRPGGIKLFCGVTDAGGDNDLYANNLAISGVGGDAADAAAYPGAGGTWDDGSDGFTSGPGAFGPWRLEVSEGGGVTQFALDDSRQVAGGLGAEISTDPNWPLSFRMTGTGIWEAAAFRDFGAPLQRGQSFSLDLAVNFRNGFKGIDVRDATEANILTFVVCCDDYSVSNATTGNGSVGSAYSNLTAFKLTMTQTSQAGGEWELRRSGVFGVRKRGTYTGRPASIKAFCTNTDSAAAENDLYINNLKLTTGRSPFRVPTGP